MIKLIQENKDNIVILFIITQLIWIIVALWTIIPNPTDNKPRTNCEYKSIWWIINLWYVITCELYKQRF